jgi:hypothetical protein
MPQESWHTVEVHWKATTTTSSTDGIVEVWVDGTRYVNLTVDNTFTSNLNIQRFELGISTNNPTSGTVSYEAYDDLAVNDSLGTINNGQIGDGRVVMLVPNGAGSNTVLTRGGTDTGANWSQCNEIPPSAAQYVQSTNPGDRDTYALQDLPAGTWAVNCVEELVMAQIDQSTGGSLGLTVKSGATTNEGSAQVLTTAAVYLRQLWETDPNTSAAWTNAAVNALEAGATVR